MQKCGICCLLHSSSDAAALRHEHCSPLAALRLPTHLLISSKPLHPTGVLDASAARGVLLVWLLLLLLLLRLPPLWLASFSLAQPAGGADITNPCVVVKQSVVENLELCKPRTSVTCRGKQTLACVHRHQQALMRQLACCWHTHLLSWCGIYTSLNNCARSSGLLNKHFLSSAGESTAGKPPAAQGLGGEGLSWKLLWGQQH